MIRSRPNVPSTMITNTFDKDVLFNGLLLFVSSSTNPMEQSPSEANRISANKYILRIYIKPEGLLQHSQEFNTCLYPEPDQSSPCHPIPLLKIQCRKKRVRVPAKWSLTSQMFAVRRCSHLPQTMAELNDHPLSAILHMRAFPSSATWVGAMLCWHVQTYHGFVSFKKGNCWLMLSAHRSCLRRSFSYWTRGLTYTTH